MNKNICIIVGHGKSEKGGYDSGAVSTNGKHHEFIIAREIAKYAADYLGCDLMNYNGDLYLTERIKKVNKGDYDFVAEIHLNAGGGTGTEVFYYHGSPTGLKASEAICEEISQALAVKSRGAKIRLNDSGKDYFAIIRETKPCAVLIETVFIDSKSDLEKIITEEGRKACGVAIGKALESVFGKSYKQESKENFRVKVICKSLYIRGGAGTGYGKNGVVKKGDLLDIDATGGNKAWGKLADGRGWVSINPKYVRML